LGAFGHDEKYYLDTKASEPLVNPARVWVKRVGAERSEVIEFQLECSSHQLRATSNAVYDAKGSLIGGSDVPGFWTDIAPDTLGEQLWNGICRTGS
ncbi:MAG: hypothetical protein KGL37_01875, partial [Acidobacteriota bacterium]|nr:hypothetical protein [Acidobacteriota bacterium]